MKKKALVIVLCGLMLAGCSSGGAGTAIQNESNATVEEPQEENSNEEEQVENVDDSKSGKNVLNISEISNSNEISIEETAENYKDLELLDSGWMPFQSDGSSYVNVYYAVQMHNPNEEYAVMFPTITITAKSADGSILATDDMVLSSIAAGDTVYYGNSMLYEGNTAPASVEITLNNSNDDFVQQDDNEYAKQSDFVVSNVAENAGDWDRTFTGEIQNNSNFQTSLAVIAILKQDGALVGGEIAYVDDIDSGASKAFEIDVSNDLTGYNTVEFYAIQW